MSKGKANSKVKVKAVVSKAKGQVRGKGVYTARPAMMAHLTLASGERRK